MRKNMVLLWGNYVGITRKTWGQRTGLYTKARGVVVYRNGRLQSFQRVSRTFSQTLSPVLMNHSYLSGTAFYPLSTPRNNNNFSKYLLSN